MNASIPFGNLFRVSKKPGTAFSSSRLCPLTHNYQDHPLMQLESLKRLANCLEKTNQCRFIGRGTADSSPFDHHAKNPDGRNVDQVFEQIANPGSWIALYDVQTDPEYQRFLSQVMSTVGDLIDPSEKITDIRGFIFISAPPSVTPFHIDRENNFWLQVKGQKTIHLWDRTDRDVVSARDVETFIAYRSLENVRLKDEFRSRSVELCCHPGDGVYFPSTTPHMTHATPDGIPGNEVSISIGINFYTSLTRRTAYVHAANGLLRRLGLNPASPGNGELRDRLKYPLGRAIVAGKTLLRGYKPPPGF